MRNVVTPRQLARLLDALAPILFHPGAGHQQAVQHIEQSLTFSHRQVHDELRNCERVVEEALCWFVCPSSRTVDRHPQPTSHSGRSNGTTVLTAAQTDRYPEGDLQEHPMGSRDRLAANSLRHSPAGVLGELGRSCSSVWDTHGDSRFTISCCLIRAARVTTTQGPVTSSIRQCQT